MRAFWAALVGDFLGVLVGTVAFWSVFYGGTMAVIGVVQLRKAIRYRKYARRVLGPQRRRERAEKDHGTHTSHQLAPEVAAAGEPPGRPDLP